MREMDEMLKVLEELVGITPDEELIYCPVCRHFRCPVAKGDEFGEHLPDEPCGYYDCCIN